MIILWLLMMGLFIAYLAVPLARWLDWEYGRFGRVGDMLLVIGGTLLGGVVLVAFLGLIGQFAIGDAGALGFGFSGALIALGLLILFSTASAASEPNETRDIPPAPPTNDSIAPQPFVPTEDKAHPVQ
jgi:hypothetical protein